MLLSLTLSVALQRLIRLGQHLYSRLRARFTLVSEPGASNHAPLVLSRRSFSSKMPPAFSLLQMPWYAFFEMRLRRRVGLPPSVISTPENALAKISLSSSVP